MANGPIPVNGSFRDLISPIWSIAELLGQIIGTSGGGSNKAGHKENAID